MGDALYGLVVRAHGQADINDVDHAVYENAFEFSYASQKFDAQFFQVLAPTIVRFEETIDLEAEVFVGLNHSDDVGGTFVGSDYEYSEVVVTASPKTP